MKRYRSRGGFRCLMLIAEALTVIRLTLIALSICLFFVCSVYAAGAVLAVSLLTGWIEYRMIHVLDLATCTACKLEIVADALTQLAVFAYLAARFLWFQIPAGILSLLSLSGMTGRLCRSKQPAV